MGDDDYDQLWVDTKDDNDQYKSLYRWIKAFQYDYAARADWCVFDYDSANHRPEVNIARESDREVDAGSQVILDTSGTTDPDGDELIFKWWQYADAGDVYLTGYEWPGFIYRSDNNSFSWERIDCPFSYMIEHIIINYEGIIFNSYYARCSNHFYYLWSQS